MAVASVRFWGVRGSLPTPGAQTARYGGNTACVEVHCGDRRLILDGGSGLRALGDAASTSATFAADILFSHLHIDHVIGLPFFRPAYDPACRLCFWSAPSATGQTLAEVLARLMSAPLFPVTTAVLKAEIEFRAFMPGDALSLGDDIGVRTALLNHPGGATGYRIEYRGKTIAYITDMEHRTAVIDPPVLALAQNADLLIYDANYTDEEYAEHAGWGHSTWREAVRLADAADVKQLALFHHDPGHDDILMDAIEAAARAVRAATFAAREGLVVEL